MRWCVRLLLSTLAILASMSFGPPAYADTGPSDLKVWTDPAKGKVGDLVVVKLHFNNLGPGDTQTGQVKWEYVAPTGAELLGFTDHLDTDQIRYVEPSANCTWTVPKTRLTCNSVASYFYIPQQPDSSGLIDYGNSVVLRIKKPITAPGLYRVACRSRADYGHTPCTDPKLGNNSASIVINGVTAVKPKPKPTPTTSGPAPTASPSAKAAKPTTAKPTTAGPASASPSADPTAIDIDQAETTLAPDPLAAPDAGTGTPVATVIAISAGSAFVLLGAGLLVALGARRRRQEQD